MQWLQVVLDTATAILVCEHNLSNHVLGPIERYLQSDAWLTKTHQPTSDSYTCLRAQFNQLCSRTHEMVPID